MEEVHRAGHMVCTREGNRGKRVLLIGHMDTVFEADSPFQRFEQTAGEDDRARRRRYEGRLGDYAQCAEGSE